MASQPSTTRMDPAREQALVARARVDPAAFGELYDWYLPRIHAFVARRVEDRAVAEDLTATTFERALGAVRREDFRNASFGGFLYRVAANAVIDHARRARRDVPLWGRASDHDGGDGHGGGANGSGDIAATLGDEAAARAFSTALDREVLREALGRLSAEHRRVILLRYFDGLDPEELGAALGCSRATVAVKVHRALRSLRGAMSREAIDAA